MGQLNLISTKLWLFLLITVNSMLDSIVISGFLQGLLEILAV